MTNRITLAASVEEAFSLSHRQPRRHLRNAGRHRRKIALEPSPSELSADTWERLAEFEDLQLHQFVLAGSRLHQKEGFRTGGESS